MPLADARREIQQVFLALRKKYPGYGLDFETYVSVPGATMDPEHEMVRAIERNHAQVMGEPPQREVVSWCSDASVLSRYGIPTVNYGTSTGLMDVERGENLEIDGLVRTAETYARVAMAVCGVA